MTAILMVEDNEEILELQSALLKRAGYTVHGVANVEAALGVLNDPATPVDLVFTDIRLTGDHGGVWLAHWLATNRPEIPVLLATGYSIEAVQGALSWPTLVKPYTAKQAIVAIRRLLGTAKLS